MQGDLNYALDLKINIGSYCEFFVIMTEVYMRISYKPLWRILLDRDISKKQLREMSGISTASMAKLGKGENLTTDVLLKICEALDCISVRHIYKKSGISIMILV